MVLLAWSAHAGAAAPAAPDAPFRAPYLPASAAEVLQPVPAASDPKVREMRALQAERDAAPQDLARSLALAWSYIEYGRQVGDAHYAGYAEALLAPWLAQPSPPVATLVAQATILQYRHQFEPARDLLTQALARDPGQRQARLTLATLDMVQGRYGAARRGCAQAANGGGYEYAIACSANLLSYQGQAAQSIALLKLIEGSGPGLPAAFNAWVQGLWAESAERLGDWSQAEVHHRRALSYAPQDNFALVAYADFLLDRGRAQEVLRLLGEHAQSDTAFLRLALAQAALHSPELARYRWIMAARFEALRQRGSDFYGREQARFALELEHDAGTALVLAQQNWAVQREPWDARVCLQAAVAAHQREAVQPVIDFVKQSRLEDPVIQALIRQLDAPGSTP